MKKITLFTLALLCFAFSFSQNFNYQAVVRDAADAPVTNQSISVWIAIRIGSPTGSIVYNEEHTVTSNNQGVITLPVGGGTSGANFLAIDWAQQNQWIETRVDVTGGTNYVTLGVSKLQHVPYALHALTSESSTDAGPFDYTNNVVSNANGSATIDDFVFGSSQLDVNGGFSPALNNRMYFDKSKAAFRAGYTSGDSWDEDKVGNHSVGLGEGGIASGSNSFSMGRNANATGNYSVAFGLNAGGFADYARGFGLTARAFGQHSTAIGRQVIANSMAETQLGQYSTFVSGSADTWVPTDRLFVIGNGEEDINLALNSDALVMLKNGNTTLHGNFTIDADNVGGSAGYTLPGQDGTLNQIMQTDGAGNVSWVTPAADAIPNGGTNGYVLATDGAGVLSWVTNDDADADPTNEIELPTQTGESGKFLTTDGTAVSWQDAPDELPTGGATGQVLSTDGSGVYSWINQTATASFTTTSNVTSNTNGTIATDDFVFGSSQLDNLTGADDNSRMFFDKSKGAFRAGNEVDGFGGFDDANVGPFTVGFGQRNVASGWYASTLGGQRNVSSGFYSMTMGDNNTASGNYSVALGRDTNASGTESVALGYSITAESRGQTTLGQLNTAVAGNANVHVPTDRLLVVGNGTSDINGVNYSDAFVILKNGNTTLNGTLTIDGDNQGMETGYTFPAQDGTANQIMSTDGSGTVSWIDAPSGGGATLPVGGTNGQLLSTDGSGNYSWATDAVDDADADATNEIELPTGGTDGQVLKTDGSGNYAWITDAVDDADADATNEIELPTGGTDGQVLKTDGSGNYAWVNQTAASTVAFSTTANVTSNAPGAMATDDFVFGSTQLDDITSGTDDDSRMFFDKSKWAFRAGKAFLDDFDTANVGRGSVAFGEDNVASGNYSFVSGFGNTVTNSGSALGSGNIVSGPNSFASGRNLIVDGLSEQVFGYYNIASGGQTVSDVLTDRLFVIGNGTSPSGRSDALVMLKNGNTILNGELTIDGDNVGGSAGYTLPAQAGTNGQVMTTDGSGNVSWAAPAADGDSDPTNEIELPTQTGNSGKILSTDGTSPSWVDAPTELPTGGTIGQVLKSDGAGGSAWSSDIEATSVKIVNLPAFNVTSNSTAYTTAGEKEVGDWNVTHNTDLFNDGNHLNITNGRFTAPVSGLYFFSAQVRIDGMNGTSGAAYSRLMIVKNGDKKTFRNGLHSIRNVDSGTANWDTQSVSGILKLNANDYVSVFIESTGDTNFTLQIESGFNGYLVNRL
ncbi:hypothetical protein [uncultured Lacinutrix sp.]|uniref:C1q-like domain-containing protein n=1 Tax=uncultured Lacinutrix sp. TaxID=574032 RepID=UPI00261C45ED|nr:hypothetical protein [uncultured Lacinutrix sp.]